MELLETCWIGNDRGGVSHVQITNYIYIHNIYIIYTYIQYTHNLFDYLYQYVLPKAVAEVSEIGNL